MSFPELSIFLITALVVCATPGPSTFLMFTHAMSRESRPLIMLFIGAISANMILISIVAIGFGAILEQSPQSLLWLKIFGGTYLLLLGVGYLFSAGVDKPKKTTGFVNGSSLAVQAFLTSITNPKALLFYSAFLPSFTSAGKPFLNQIFLLGSLYLAIFTVCLFAYAMAGYCLGLVAPSSLFLKFKDKLLGCILIASGAAIINSSYSR